MRERCKLRSPHREPGSGTGKFMQGRSRKLGVNQEAEGQGRPSSPGLPPTLLSRCSSLPPPEYSRPVGSHVRSSIRGPVAVRGYGGLGPPGAQHSGKKGQRSPDSGRDFSEPLSSFSLSLGCFCPVPAFIVLCAHPHLPVLASRTPLFLPARLHPINTFTPSIHLHPLHTPSPLPLHFYHPPHTPLCCATRLHPSPPSPHPHTLIFLQTPSSPPKYLHLILTPSSSSTHLHIFSCLYILILILDPHLSPNTFIPILFLVITILISSSSSKHFHPLPNTFILFLIPPPPPPPPSLPPHPPPNIFIPSKILSSLSSYPYPHARPSFLSKHLHPLSLIPSYLGALPHTTTVPHFLNTHSSPWHRDGDFSPCACDSQWNPREPSQQQG